MSIISSETKSHGEGQDHYSGMLFWVMVLETSIRPTLFENSIEISITAVIYEANSVLNILNKVNMV